MKSSMQRVVLSFCAAVFLAPVVASAQIFTYDPPGSLVPGSGQGRVDYKVYFKGMRFPIERAPVYANSQVWGVGTWRFPGSQCDPANYSYPWRDNFCESRHYSTPLCPTGTGHQGQDIRPAQCRDSVYWTVATEGGTITGIGPYSVSLQGDSGLKHRYLHLNMGKLAVRRRDRVEKGERIGLISNSFGGAWTTIHLHYEMISGGLLPPYMSLVESYKKSFPCIPGLDPRAANEVFKDMPLGSFGYAEAKILLANRITNGCSSSPRLFCSGCEVKRSHMATFIVRSQGWPLLDPDTPSFSDVPKKHTFYKYIETLAAHGVTKGCGNGKFCPNASVTRGQMAAFLRRAARWSRVVPPTPSFSDVPKGHTFRADIETIFAHGVTKGCGSGKYCPEDKLTRAQAAIFLVRTFDLR